MNKTIRNSYPTTSYNSTSNAYAYDYEYLALEEDRLRRQKVQEKRAEREKEAVMALETSCFHAFGLCGYFGSPTGFVGDLS